VLSSIRGDFKLKIEDIDLNELLIEVTDKMSIKAGEKKGRITYNSPHENGARIQGDKVHLDNVFYNLIDNAIKYTQNPPEVNLSLKKNGTHWVVEVQDNGIGISKENQKKVFERLYRVPTGNRHDVKGFGLGLNYVSTIIKRHQGKVDLESTLGRGSTFSVYLPQ
jgi:two-component system phosphate regulon sensor histidine kinase PhoR